MSIIGKQIEWKTQSGQLLTGVVVDKIINGYNQSSPSTVYLVVDPITCYSQTVLPVTIQRIFGLPNKPPKTNQSQLDEMLGRVDLPTTNQSSPSSDDDLPF